MHQNPILQAYAETVTHYDSYNESVFNVYIKATHKLVPYVYERVYNESLFNVYIKAIGKHDALTVIHITTHTIDESVYNVYIKATHKLVPYVYEWVSSYFQASS